eukprot:Tamp_08506.p1 GENE.Tamp_08506~~Tamp_08506.p1  ORF type:complete len:411 (-),score=142.91 Tamp_08506:1086-2273(-)
MLLEATVICVDNSEWMRNGDYVPTRMDSQADAVNLICNTKTTNPESAVGVMTMASRSPEILVTPTPGDHAVNKILTALHGVKIEGENHFCSAIQVASLALKHRQNKHQRQRIIIFVGSPLMEDQKELVKLGKKLKKNDVAVDVINFGETAENQEKLEAFIGAVNKNENSNLLTVPPGPHILSDIIISSSICNSGDGEGGGGGGMGAGSFDMGGGGGGGFDADLEMALRISAEEERQRQEREAARAAGEGGAPAPAEGGATATPAAMGAAMADDDDDMLQQALAMSMAESQPKAAAEETPKSEVPASASKAADAMDEDEDEELKLAMAMSVEPGAGAAGGDAAGGAAMTGLLQDPGFLTDVLSSLPGVDTSDPRVKGVLDGMKDEKKEDKKDEGAK